MLLSFAVNHMTVANASYQALLHAASTAGCVGVEVRNDLAGELFDGADPAVAGQMARDQGLRILALAEVKAFNHFSADVLASVRQLAAIATACGAEGISLIPANDNTRLDSNTRMADLKLALSQIKPVLEDNNLIGFVEPLGFGSSSLRHKSELVELIEDLDAVSRFKIVHDTFHHHLAASDAAAKNTFFPAHTGLIHISGVSDCAIAVTDMADEHRVLVDAADRLQNLQQLTTFVNAGYAGPVSVEAFAPQVHQYTDPVARLTESFNYIKSEINAVAA